jgi:hypothetical protein
MPVSFFTSVSPAPAPACHSPDTVTFAASFEYTLNVTLLSGRISGDTILAGALKAGRAAGAAAGREGSCPETKKEEIKIVTNVTIPVFKFSFILKSPIGLIIL